MKADLFFNFLGAAVVGMVALAMDYFFLQYFFKTPVSMGGGLTVWAVLLYLIVPFAALIAGGAKET